MKQIFPSLLVLCVCLGYQNVKAQSFPEAFDYDEQTHTISMGTERVTGLYNDEKVRVIRLYFDQPNFWQTMTANFNSKTNLMANMMIDSVRYDSVGVRFKGQTSYSRVRGDKKSFNITTDFMIDGQDVKGYQTMNLNNAYQDPSFLRDVLFTHLVRPHIPVVKSAYTHLYINDQSWGLYPSVQQINKDFMKEWWLSNDGTLWRCDRPNATGGNPGFGNGTAALNYLGSDTTQYQTYYTLKSTEEDQPWDLLVKLTDVLENTPLTQLEDSISKYMDLDRTLWFLAAEIMFTDDDGYVFKGSMDYWLHWEKETGRAVPQEYDANTVMDPGKVTTWSPFYRETEPNFPLMNRLFAVPSIRQRYLAHFRTMMKESLNQSDVEARIDTYVNLVDSLVQMDPKKIYSYANFVSEVQELKDFVRDRYIYLSNHVEVAQQGVPIISAETEVDGIVWGKPAPNEVIDVRATISQSVPVAQVDLFYATDLVGQFTKVPMFDDGNHNDGAANDGIYGSSIPGFSAGTWVRFYIQSTAANASNTLTYLPVGAEHDVYAVQVQAARAGQLDIVINEIMAKNDNTAMDEAGQYDDWIELYNKGNQSIDISGWILSDKTTNFLKWEIPAGTVMDPDEYLIIWADEDGSQGTYHANFKLDGDGEVLYLYNDGLELVDSLSFGPQTEDMGYARVPNGTGSFVIQHPTFAFNNETPVNTTSTFLLADLNIFPNPADDLITVQIEDGIESTELFISDLIGNKIWSGEISNSRQISVQGWPEGMYLLSCKGVTKRFVVTH